MGLMLMPAKAGTCQFCATKHSEHLPHNYWSLFYGMRFKMAYGRDPTHADAAAHCSDEVRQQYRAMLAEMGYAWNEPQGGASVVVERYVESEGKNIRIAREAPRTIDMSEGT